MKTLNEIKVILESTHLPVAYHHFAEGESPGPPFIVFLSPGSHNFSADGIVYQTKKKHISIAKSYMKSYMKWRYSRWERIRLNIT